MRWKTGLFLPFFPAIAAAQVMPTLSDAAPFTLALPYLEYMAAGSATRNAFAINLKSTNLATFTLDVASVKTQTAFSNAVNAPQVSVSGMQFLLTIPYLSFTNGGVSKAFSLTFTTADFLTYSPLISSVKELTVLAVPSSVAVTNGQSAIATGPRSLDQLAPARTGVAVLRVSGGAQIVGKIAQPASRYGEFASQSAGFSKGILHPYIYTLGQRCE